MQKFLILLLSVATITLSAIFDKVSRTRGSRLDKILEIWSMVVNSGIGVHTNDRDAVADAPDNPFY